MKRIGCYIAILTAPPVQGPKAGAKPAEPPSARWNLPW